MKRSSYLSLAVLASVSAWMLSGPLLGSAERALDVADPGPRAVTPMKVQVRNLVASTVTREVVVQGQLEPRRRIEVRAEAGGQVTSLPVAKGARVDAGQLLVKLAADDRPAQLAQARAELAQRQLELEAVGRLYAKKMQPETQMKLAEAAVAAAEARLEVTQTELDRTRIQAPFAGVLELRPAEIGTLVERGDTVAELVDDQVLKAVGQVPQQSAAKLALGQQVTMRLLDGREAHGQITFLARVAESGTRSFRIEAEIPNPDGLLNAGVSAELRVAVGEEQAHFVSPAVLTLDDFGTVGIKSISSDDRVEFHPVKLVRTQVDGVWVSGLPAQVRVITQGQGFVASGEAVIPLPEA